MVEIVKRNKALSVSPLKSSQTVGAALAFLGFERAIPMLHGSQGCTAFGKVFFVRHFREPIPLQTTAVDQVSAVMGADANVVEGLRTICEKSRPDLIGVPTTGLTEAEGCDIRLAVREFRAAHPGFDDVAVVPVAAPDFAGCLETGFAAATRAVLETLVPEAAAAGTRPGRQPRQVNVLAGAALTPGDVEALKDLVAAFGLHAVVVPDLSGSLDGHLGAADFTPLTMGGTPVAEVATLGDAAATLVVGASMGPAADLLKARTGVPDLRFDHLMGLEAVDVLVAALAAISGHSVPERLERGRARLQDAMLDTHFMLGMSRVAIAADPDLLVGFSALLAGMGAEVVAAVAPTNAPSLQRIAADRVKIGDLEDLEALARAGRAEVLIGNSHLASSAERLGRPLLRAGFPQFDRVGGFGRPWIGYDGTRQALFDLANLLMEHPRGEVPPYRSRYSQKTDDDWNPDHGPATATEGAGLRH